MAFGDFVQQVATTGASGVATTPTISAATAGNLLVLTMGRAAGGGTPPTPSGFTALSTGGTPTGALLAAWWYKIAAGGETTVSLSGETGTSGNWRMSLAEFEAPYAASPLDQSNEDETNISTAVASQGSGSVTTTQADTLLLAFFAADAAANVDTSRTYSNSFTERYFENATTSPARPALAVASRVVAAIGTYSTTFSVTDTGDEQYGAIAAFKKVASNPTASITSPSDGAAVTSRPTITITATDPDGDAVRFNVQLTTNPSSYSTASTIADSNTGAATLDMHPNPMLSIGWEGTQQLDDRPAQSYKGGNGYLEKIILYLGKDPTLFTGCKAKIRIYAHEGVYGVDGYPRGTIGANPFTGAGLPSSQERIDNTPPRGWLAESDLLTLPSSISTTESEYTFTFSGVNRIAQPLGMPFFWMLCPYPDAAYPANTDDCIVVFGNDAPAGHAGNSFIAGSSVNYGFLPSQDFKFKMHETYTVIDVVSGTDPGFSAGDPYASGATVTYTPPTALASGLAWRVRVRASDPAGSNSYGAYSADRTIYPGDRTAFEAITLRPAPFAPGAAR